MWLTMVARQIDREGVGHFDEQRRSLLTASRDACLRECVDLQQVIYQGKKKNNCQLDSCDERYRCSFGFDKIRVQDEPGLSSML